MLSFLIDIILGIGLFAVGFYLHKSALQRPDPNFGRVDFLFAYVMYLAGIGRFLAAFQLVSVRLILLSCEIAVVYYLLFTMIKVVPRALKEPTRAKLVEQTIEATLEKTSADAPDEIQSRTRDEIYAQIMNERSD